MANFFPAASRLDVERAPSLNRRAQSRNTLREGDDSSSSDGRPSQSRPSHINWLPSPTATTQQAGPPMPRRPPSARLGRSASLSALAGSQPTLHRQSSLSNHSLQLDKSAGAATSAHPTGAQLSPISERSYTSTPKREHIFTDVEPSTPVSIGSSYSAFLRRPLKRSISATSTSSLRTNATSTHPPILPPLNISPLELRPVYPPVSHRAGQQLVSTVYEDAGSERTGSFVTARSVALNGEEDGAASPDFQGPSHSTILSSPTAAHFGSRSDALVDFDRTTEGTTTLLGGGGGGGYSGDGSSNGNGSGDVGISSNSSSGGVPPVRPRPRKRTPTSGASGGETFIWRRWTGELSFGSHRLSRPSFSAARRAFLSRLPPLPILLFWAGFLAPWCWLIGGWLIEEGRWEDSGKARAALPLWKPRSTSKRHPGGGKAVVVGGGKGAGADGSQVQPDSFGKDLEKGDAATAAAVAAREAQTGAGEGEAGAERVREGGEVGAASAPRRMMPFTCWRHGAAVTKELGPSPHGEKVITLVKPYSAEVWVYRCRLAAVVSALILLTALIVAVVVIGGSTRKS